MKRLFMICLALAAFGSAAAQKQVTVTQQLDPFTTLRVSGNLSVDILPQPAGQGPSMTVELGGNDERSFSWNNRSGRLTVRMTYPNRGAARIKLYCDSLSAIVADGADLQTVSSLQSRTLAVTVRGGSKLRAEITCTDLALNVSENSAAVLSGKCSFVAAKILNHSVMDSRELSAGSMDASVRGGSQAFVYSSDRLVIDVRQGGKAFYKGEPEVLRTRTSAGSTLNSIGK